MSDRVGEDSGPDRAPTGDFEQPGDRDSEAAGPRLRRRLFGARREDVAAELARRDAEIAELRRDIAALWLAFGQHERALHRILAAIERVTGAAVRPPEGHAPSASTAAAAGSGTGSDDPIGDQLSDLDDVLAAIEQATRSLERIYADHVHASGSGESPGRPSGGPDAAANADAPDERGRGEGPQST